MPHYAYARSDKKDAPRISIAGRLVADLLVTAGANRVLTMTLHSPQVHGFFSVPIDHLHALRELAQHFRRYDLTNAVVVSPDLGNAKQAAAFARLLGTGVAVGAKQRFSDDRVSIATIIGNVTDRDVIVLDDEIAKGSTVFELLARLREQKVESVRVACTHGLFSSDALKRLEAQPDVLEITCTNTVPIRPDKACAQADRAVGGAGAGRGDAPDPQRRVGERPVPAGLADPCPTRPRRSPPRRGRARRPGGRPRRRSARSRPPARAAPAPRWAAGP
jgi:ribose-phosphate pyrophosphokinase